MGGLPLTLRSQADGSSRFDDIVERDIFGPDLTVVRMVIVSHPAVMPFKRSAGIVDHITLIGLVAQYRAATVKPASVIQPPNKYPPQVRQNTTGISACQLGV